MTSIQVWDWPLRLCHWGLAVAIVGAYGTAELGWLDMEWHFRFGYLALGLVLFRLLWGIAGTRHSRFASFLRGPGAVIAYLRGGSAQARAWVGHSPLAGWATLMLLLAVLVQVSSGLFNYDDIEWFGPLYDFAGRDLQRLAHRVHDQAFWALLGLIALHLLAILWYLLRGRNLIPAMLHGRQQGQSEQAAEAFPWWRFAVVLLIVLASVYVISNAPALFL